MSLKGKEVMHALSAASGEGGRGTLFVAALLAATALSRLLYNLDSVQFGPALDEIKGLPG